MKKSSVNFRVGTRASKLALIQTRNALDKMAELLPALNFTVVEFSSPGDRDKSTDLRISDPDFFTRDLDEAILDRTIDFAVHSAKDLPDPVPDDIDWFWLPWSEDARDAIILARGKTMHDIGTTPIVGISSQRREEWCNARFPGARIKNIRGNIAERLAQLDAGEYDMLVMAGAALTRLNLTDRISEWISTAELAPPDGQGRLAITFRAGDSNRLRIRSLFVHSVNFVGAGIGSADMCTLAGIKALQNCEVCLHDSLMPQELLDYLPADAQRIDVGKRCGDHKMAQDEITALVTMYARRGGRVVRLKGGDPGIFGRLAEEVEALDALELPYHVTPGISSLNMATTATGMLATRRDVSRGFCVMTPRQKGGGLASVKSVARAQLPMIFFMAGQATNEVATQLIEDGVNPDTPAAIVYAAGTGEEKIFHTTLHKCIKAGNKQAEEVDMSAPPALFIVGDITQYSFKHHGPLRGNRVLITSSGALQEKTVQHVLDLDGTPLRFPLIKLELTEDALENAGNLSDFEWIVLTSPSSVRCFMELIQKAGLDLRQLPKIAVCGEGTSMELKKHGTNPDLMPESGFSASALMGKIKPLISRGTKILRLRSDKAGPHLAGELRENGAHVEDCLLYKNSFIKHEQLPQFDAVFFASASAVESFLAQWTKAALKGKIIVTIGQPTTEALNASGITDNIIVAREATVFSAIQTLAAHYITESI